MTNIAGYNLYKYFHILSFNNCVKINFSAKLFLSKIQCLRWRSLYFPREGFVQSHIPYSELQKMFAGDIFKYTKAIQNITAGVCTEQHQSMLTRCTCPAECIARQQQSYGCTCSRHSRRGLVQEYKRTVFAYTHGLFIT